MEFLKRAHDAQDKQLEVSRCVVSNTACLMGVVFMCQREYRKVLILFIRALDGHKRTIEGGDPDVLNAVRIIGNVSKHQVDDDDKAVACFRPVIETLEKLEPDVILFSVFFHGTGILGSGLLSLFVGIRCWSFSDGIMKLQRE